VLKFYAQRLSDPDRYLLAAVSLFARPVDAAAVLTVARHEVFRRRLAGWTPAMVQAAVRDRLSGLASWHPDGTISAHPLVRETFRAFVMDAAETAAETTLTGMPAGHVANRVDALRAVEAIELLLAAGQWEPADDMYISRCDDGYVWLDLPAVRLGQRAATAFVATRARRAACSRHLGADRLCFYLNEVGLFAKNAGDLVTAREYEWMVVRRDRDADDATNLSIDLQNLADCLGHSGEMGPAREAADVAFRCAKAVGDRRGLCDSHACLAWLAGLAGESAEAERQFLAADQIAFAELEHGAHLSSTNGIQWAEWLARTERAGAAQRLTRNNADLNRDYGLNQDAARCDQLLGRLALTAGDFADLVRRIMGFAPGPGRTVLALEGGYDLDALRLSVGSSMAALLDGPYRPEAATSGGPGGDVVDAVRRIHSP